MEVGPMSGSREDIRRLGVDGVVKTACNRRPWGRGVAVHPERITQPMRRTSAGWKNIDCDTAYDILVENLGEIKEKYGPRALAVAIGMPVLLGGNATVSFLRRFCDI